MGRYAALDVQDRGTRGGRKAGKGIARRDAVAYGGLRTALHFDAGDVVLQTNVSEFGIAGRARGDEDALSARGAKVPVVAHDRIEHLQFTIGDSGREVDARYREMIDRAFLDLHGAARDDGDTAQASAQPFKVEPPENDYVGGIWNVDNNAIGSRDEHAGLETFRRDGDRLGDRYGAEAARIENVDFSTGSGLGDGTGEGLTWRCAAAWIRVVADT